MKVIRIDNYARDSIADKLIRDEMNPQAAEAYANDLNEANTDDAYFYMAVEDGYRLSRGMEDLI